MTAAATIASSAQEENQYVDGLTASEDDDDDFDDEPAAPAYATAYAPARPFRSGMGGGMGSQTAGGVRATTRPLPVSDQDDDGVLDDDSVDADGGGTAAAATATDVNEELERVLRQVILATLTPTSNPTPTLNVTLALPVGCASWRGRAQAAGWQPTL